MLPDLNVGAFMSRGLPSISSDWWAPWPRTPLEADVEEARCTVLCNKGRHLQISFAIFLPSTFADTAAAARPWEVPGLSSFCVVVAVTTTAAASLSDRPWRNCIAKEFRVCRHVPRQKSGKEREFRRVKESGENPCYPCVCVAASSSRGNRANERTLQHASLRCARPRKLPYNPASQASVSPSPRAGDARAVCVCVHDA